MNRLKTNFLLLSFSVVVTFLALEAGVRAVTAFDRNYLDELVNYRSSGEERDLTLADMIRPVSDDLLVYELRPGVRGSFLGHDLVINSLGMRDVERLRAKEEGVFRILSLGDSHAFGWGVAMEETYAAQLEEMLEKEAGGEFEVLNMGVPGYNTVQEVQAFVRLAGELSPDMVLINYVNNDMDLPNFLGSRPNLLTPRKSYLLELVRRRVAIIRGSRLFPAGLSRVEPDTKSKRYRMPEDRIPERFRPLYGWENMKEAYRELGRLARERGIPYVVLFNMDDYSFRLAGKTPTVLPRNVREVAALCGEEGYLVVDPQDRVAAYLEENGLGTQAVWITPKDSHTNVLRHRFVAEELYERLRSAGYLPSHGS